MSFRNFEILRDLITVLVRGEEVVPAAAEAMEKEDEAAAGRKADSVLEKDRLLTRGTKNFGKDRREVDGQRQSVPVTLSLSDSGNLVPLRNSFRRRHMACH